MGLGPAQDPDASTGPSAAEPQEADAARQRRAKAVLQLAATAHGLAERVAHAWDARGPPSWFGRHNCREVFGSLLWEAARADGDSAPLAAYCWVASALEAATHARDVSVGVSTVTAKVAWQEGFAALRAWMRRCGINDEADLAACLRGKKRRGTIGKPIGLQAQLLLMADAQKEDVRIGALAQAYRELLRTWAQEQVPAPVLEFTPPDLPARGRRRGGPARPTREPPWPLLDDLDLSDEWWYGVQTLRACPAFLHAAWRSALGAALEEIRRASLVRGSEAELRA